jgi:hypothetical protein
MKNRLILNAGVNGYKSTISPLGHSLFILLILIGVNFHFVWADCSLQLMHTIHFNLDSTYVTSTTNVGDYNGDGFDDLLIGMGTSIPFIHSPHESAYMFFGGTTFDTIPDLIFIGESQAWDPNVGVTGFGSRVCKLGDFNGDGYDDFAIAAPYFNGIYDWSGKIYIYFGGIEADTIADLIISGWRSWDQMGNEMKSGDYNGDGLGDLVTMQFHEYNFSRINLYLGSDIPDTISDWHYYDNQLHADIFDLYGGYDFNGDGKDDFGWCSIEPYQTEPHTLVFMGSDTLPMLPTDTSPDGYYYLAAADISGDGINDLILASPQGEFLCLGGQEFNLSPGYDIGRSITRDIYPFSLPLGTARLLCDFGHEYILKIFNKGIPFDTIPYCSVNYGPHLVLPNKYFGDINADHIGELILADSADNIEIYSFAETSIDDDGARIPIAPILLSAYPNPFNSTTTLSIFGIDKANISIFDITGRLVTTLHADQGKAVWNAVNMPSGVYFARVSSPQSFETTKLILLE